jgi:thiamine biosynthesis lipoprotein
LTAHKIEFGAMGTQIMVAVDNDDPQVGKQLEQVPGWFEEWEQALSRFRPNSELSQLNQSEGYPFRASPILWEVLQEALNAALQSEGLVSPTHLTALEAAGYVQSYPQMTGRPAERISNPEILDAGPEAIQLDQGARTVVLPRGMRLDFGGIAKGWAAQQTVKRLQGLGAVIANAGGDIALSIPQGEAQGWDIEVKDAYALSKVADTIQLIRGGVATSGRDRRRWQQDGHWQHHIIDPRTGQPAETDVLAATVIANSAVEAEMAAKVVLILGSLPGLDWLAQRSGCHGMVFLDTGNIVYSPGFQTHLRTDQWH